MPLLAVPVCSTPAFASIFRCDSLIVLESILIILEVLVIFNLIIIVHELGHFLAARWRGLVIEEFGIWFGKPLWKKKINGVEYSLGSIPAGGFVALPQMAPMESIEGKVETPREQSPAALPLDKIIVAFAGPLFSFLLALVFACIVLVVGQARQRSGKHHVIGYVAKDSPADKAGLGGDKILEVDGQPVTQVQRHERTASSGASSQRGHDDPFKSSATARADLPSNRRCDEGLAAPQTRRSHRAGGDADDRRGETR